MAIKYYALNTELYEPYWITDESVVPYDHIETICSGIQEYVDGQLWIEMSNHHIEWKDVDTVEASGTLDKLPLYLKIVVDETPYYYYLIDRPSILAVKDGRAIYQGAYALDEYNTVYNKKISIILENDPQVLTNRCFDNRWYEMEYGKRYTIDFIKQRYLSNTVHNNNFMTVRELAYSTTPDKLWTLNFPSASIPSEGKFTKWAGTDTWSIPFETFKQANTRGRYEYIVCKPTSIMSSNNSTLRSCSTKQKYIIIPLLNGYQEQILHALNDFDIKGNHNVLLDPFGDNQIGLYECDVPFTMFLGYNTTNQYGVELKYIAQPMDSSSSVLNVPFFYLNTNAPMLFKIVDYTQYTGGMYGKFLKFIENIGEWTPETEPALWNPYYYKEVYNNGNSNLVSDASRFVFKWSDETLEPMGVQAFLSWSDSLNIAYNYGDLTNTALPTLDNTESVDGSLSLANMYFGSASANYFTSNATTTATGIQVRKSEETQSWVDASLNAASSVADAAIQTAKTRGLFKKISVGAAAGTKAAINIAKTMTDTAMEQERANNQFRSGINNLVSSPAPLLSNASAKAVIPNKNDLFATWAIKIHPNDEKVAFTDYTHNGYPANEVKKFSKVFNRKIMNILDIDTNYNKEDLRNILYWNDNDYNFNTPFWNAKFLAWLNSPHKVYNTWWMVNCTDYYGHDYISNIEKELPILPTPKTHIETLINNFRDRYIASKLEASVKEDNSDAPTDVWDDVEFIDINYNHFIIKTKKESKKYFGSIIVNKVVYNGYLIDGNDKHYFFDLNFMCAPSINGDWTIKTPDGKKSWSNKVFNKHWEFEGDYTTYTSIGNNFLANCTAFRGNDHSIDVARGSNDAYKITSIGDNFLYNCYSFDNATPSTSGSGYRVGYYLWLPPSITHIGKAFMYGCKKFFNGLNTKHSLGLPEPCALSDIPGIVHFRGPITVFEKSDKSFDWAMDHIVATFYYPRGESHSSITTDCWFWILECKSSNDEVKARFPQLGNHRKVGAAASCDGWK